MSDVAMTSRPRLALTLGDPAGIGPEIVLKALADPWVHQQAHITVFGHRPLLEKCYSQLRSRTSEPLLDPVAINIVDCPTSGAIQIGLGNVDSGEASFTYLKTAIHAALDGSVAGVVTAPIAKFAWYQAGHQFPGQTEVCAQLSGTQRYGMLFAAQSPHSDWILKVLLATTHISLRTVPDLLTPELLKQKLDLLVDTLQHTFQIQDPVIAVPGLNPHSGEAGHLGNEEVEWLTPLLRSYTQARVLGPIPPDTLWVTPARAWQDPAVKAADAYLALYHDQGLIPVKMLAFDQAVNTTIGLPFVRTSPDHGTAFDIAGQGIARAESLKASITLAAQMVSQ